MPCHPHVYIPMQFFIRAQKYRWHTYQKVQAKGYLSLTKKKLFEIYGAWTDFLYIRKENHGIVCTKRLFSFSLLLSFLFKIFRFYLKQYLFGWNSNEIKFLFLFAALMQKTANVFFCFLIDPEIWKCLNNLFK